MPNKSELQSMTKAQLIDFGCDFFEDDGNLRAELSSMKKTDLLDLLIENGAANPPPPEPTPDLSPKAARGPLDLGS